MSKLLSVIRFTFRNQVRTKGFVIGSLFFVILITIGVHLPLIIQAFNPDHTEKVAVLPSNTGMGEALHQYYAQQDDPGLIIMLLADQGSMEANEQLAQSMLFEGEIEGYLVFEEAEGELTATAQYKSDDAGSSTQNELQTALQLIRTNMVVEQLGLSEEQYAQLNTPFVLQGVHVSEHSDGKTSEQIAMTIIFVFVMLSMLFGATFGGGAMVATEVSSEKSSRVMEILITSVSPLTQMFGKVIAVFLTGLLQLLIYTAAAIINLMLPHNKAAFANFNLDLSGLSLDLLVYFILFYLLGYFAYAVMFAAAGSVVSRTEDVNQVITPIMIISMVTFYVAIFSVNNAGALYVEILSFVPLFMPILMFIRIGLSDPALWEVALSVAINVLFILIVGWLAAKVYRAGVLMYGKKPEFKEIWKAMRYR